jgi:pimeloyl-ACP methyl ester carboxylesterase
MKVVLLHAFPLGPEMWEPQHDVLAEHDVFAPNLYELGSNSLAEWARRILERVDGEFAAVGASLGGYVALALARAARKRVGGLFLAGARAGADDVERRTARDKAIATLRNDGIEAWAPSAPAPPAPDVSVEELVRATEAMRDRLDSADVVAGFRGPLWVVVGDADPFLPVEEAREIAAAAPNGRVHVIEGAGHFTNAERPDRFNELLAEFLAQPMLAPTRPS